MWMLRNRKPAKFTLPWNRSVNIHSFIDTYIPFNLFDPGVIFFFPFRRERVREKGRERKEKRKKLWSVFPKVTEFYFLFFFFPYFSLSPSMILTFWRRENRERNKEKNREKKERKKREKKTGKRVYHVLRFRYWCWFALKRYLLSSERERNFLSFSPLSLSFLSFSSCENILPQGKESFSFLWISSMESFFMERFVDGLKDGEMEERRNSERRERKKK